MKYKNVLSIAGSDPSGGAGIQADLKTFTSLGVYGCAVVTALTVQNTKSFKDVTLIDHNLIKAQIEIVLEDIRPSFIKIGMLGSGVTAKSVGESVRGLFIICDPVMFSKHGSPLLQENSLELFENFVIANSTVLTPNYDELLILSHKKNAVNDRDFPYRPEAAGRMILDKYKNLKALVIKGGHINENEPVIADILLLRKGRFIYRYEFKHPRVFTDNTHGTGCTLSSAITAFLARGYDIKEAVSLASDYVFHLIKLASTNKIGKGRGALPHHMYLYAPS
jgi:hydroxymethylpyrimidine/phosphomethylpyrimidine kinase